MSKSQVLVLPLVDTVYCVVEEDFMVVDSCDVEWRGCGVFGVPAALLLFRNRRGGPHFLQRGCLMFVVVVDSRFAIGGGEY